MKKLIIYPDDIHTDLRVLSAKANTNLTKYIEGVLIDHVEQNKDRV